MASLGVVQGYRPMDSFGEDAADVYDADPRGDESSTVALLDELGRGGPALELAIGTGRIALPLAARGIRVDGVDLSPGMVARLRAKPGGKQLPITMGDFADVPVEGTYRLIYLVFNTLFNLLTQDDQVRCSENVAKNLTDDGLFVVEAFVPTFLARLRDDQHVGAEHVGSIMSGSTSRATTRSPRATWCCPQKDCASSRSSRVTHGPASST